MKIILLFLSILSLISCDQIRSQKVRKVELNKSSINTSDSSNIYGIWTMCSTYSNGSYIQFNVCPIIEFRYNGSGSVITSNIEKERFLWSLKKNNLAIFYTDGFNRHTFQDSIYTINVIFQDDRTVLEIKHLNQDHVYYLSK